VARATARNPGRTKPVENGAIPRSLETSCWVARWWNHATWLCSARRNHASFEARSAVAIHPSYVVKRNRWHPTPAFSCGARSAFDLAEQSYL